MRIQPAFAPLFALSLSVSGCGMFQPHVPNSAPGTDKAPPPATAPLGAAGQSAASLDQTTEAEKAAAKAAPASAGRALGSVSVALGSPAEQGFWLKTPLVAAPGKGRVTLANGKSVAVDLLPGQAGSLLSLPAYRALGLALTDLPQVTVTAE
jgi:hypothetical protein